MILARIAVAYGFITNQERPVKKIACALAVPALLTLSACGLEDETRRATSSPRHPLLTEAGTLDGTPVAVAPPVEGADTALPDSLRCVSEPLPNTNEVLRVDMWRDMDGTFTTS